jgi:hypothetical protein
LKKHINQRIDCLFPSNQFINIYPSGTLSTLNLRPVTNLAQRTIATDNPLSTPNITQEITTMSATNNLPTLSLEAAKIASEAAQEKAKEMGIGTFTVVVERHSQIRHTPKQNQIKPRR